MNKTVKLSEVDTGASVYISNIHGKGAFRQRIGEMGFVKGKKVTVIKNAPLNDPIEFSIMGYNISLRRNEASMIDVSNTEIPQFTEENLYSETISMPSVMAETGPVIRVAMVGNPNSGKTSLFNFASHSNEHVGNYTGVTVGSKTAVFKHNDSVIQITDLPGTYSISSYSPEEIFVREFILENKPDVVINVIDAANLERNLFLTTQLIDMNVKVVVALNMFDELIRMKDRFDYTNMGRMLGIPFVATVGSRGKGIKRLFHKVIEVHKGLDPYQRSVKINYGPEIEYSVEQILKKLGNNCSPIYNTNISARFMSLRLLGGDRFVADLFASAGNYKEIAKVCRDEASRIEGIMGDTAESVITDARYGFISGALKETYQSGTLNRRVLSDSIDNLLTNRFFGYPVFLFLMWVMFSATFNLGDYPQTWIENGVTYLSTLLNSHMPEGSLKNLLSEGVLGGVGGVIVFLPNILILFFFISMMEDTGYMARAAFITDKLMHKIGLHGQSFIPLIMGFGCNVPAIMATRTIENKNNRILTMLINPFMSCSARLPVYLLLIGSVFPGFKGTVLFGVYLIGILVAIGVALLLKKSVFKAVDAPFVMELPPYRLPTMRSIFKHMWGKASQYLRKMGGVILVASIIIWALGHYPQDSTTEKVQQNTVLNENSYIAQLGKVIEPVISPLGFDWRMGVCLLTGITAKEIVVSTMGVIYPEKPVFTAPVTLAFLIFTLLYSPCLATITAISKESGSWKWAALSVGLSTGLAWILSFLVYRIALVLF